MSHRTLHFFIGLVILLGLLADRVGAEPLGHVTIDGATYDIVAQADSTSPAATFTLGGRLYALARLYPPTTAPAVVVAATPPTTSPSTQPSTVATTLPTTSPSIARPEIATTGVPADTVLTKTAKLTITPGGVYENLVLTGTQTIRLAKGQTVTFRRCRIDGAGQPYGIRCDGNLGMVVIEHCEILNVGSAAVYGDNFQITASYIHRSAGDGFKPGQHAVIDGNYIAELGWNSPAAHADGVQIRGGSDIRVTGNFFNLPNDLPNTKANAALFLQLAAHDVTFDGNWCLGGNFAVHAYTDGAGGPTVHITHNTFYPGSTRYGFGSIAKDLIWTGNITDAGRPALSTDR